MISLDQVYLLEEKVESAVAKIQQLKAENDALRSKCLELTNALSSKTEQLNTFSVDQTQIEEGIRKALDRLNSIENSVLKAADQALTSTPRQTVVSEQNATVVTNSNIISDINTTIPTEHKIEENQPVIEEPILNSSVTFGTMEPVTKSQVEIDLENQFSSFNESDNSEDIPEETNSDDLGFDIF